MRLQRYQPQSDAVIAQRDIVPPRALPAETELEETYCAAYLRVHDRAYDYAERRLSPMEAEDALGEAWLKVWKRWADLRPGQRTQAYFFRAVRTCVVDALRASKRYVSLEDAEEELDTLALYASPAFTRATTSDDIVDATIAAMSPKRRETLLLIRDEGFTYKEVAHVMRVSEGTVNSHYYHAIADLRSALEQSGFKIADSRAPRLEGPNND